MARDEEQIREEMVTACKILDGLSLVEGFGHVSCRMPKADGSDHILITPRKALRLVGRDDVVVIDRQNGQVVSGKERPPLELPMHLAIYRADATVQAIVRTHSPMAAIFGVLREPIRAVHGFGCILGPTVPVFPDHHLIATLERGTAIAEFFQAQQAKAILLAGNGTIVLGQSVPHATAAAVFLEESARLQYRARCIGIPHYWTPAEVEERSQSDLPHEPIRAWEYYAARYAP